jgi:hypothetical protein
MSLEDSQRLRRSRPKKKRIAPSKEQPFRKKTQLNEVGSGYVENQSVGRWIIKLGSYAGLLDCASTSHEIHKIYQEYRMTTDHLENHASIH